MYFSQKSNALLTKYLSTNNETNQISVTIIRKQEMLFEKSGLRESLFFPYSFENMILTISEDTISLFDLYNLNLPPTILPISGTSQLNQIFPCSGDFHILGYNWNGNVLSKYKLDVGRGIIEESFIQLKEEENIIQVISLFFELIQDPLA